MAFTSDSNEVHVENSGPRTGSARRDTIVHADENNMDKSDRQTMSYGNIFSRFNLFFSHKLCSQSKLSRLAILPSLIDDLISRKLFAFDAMVRQLVQFCQERKEDPVQCRVFLGALIQVLELPISSHGSRDCLHFLAHMVLKIPDAFEELLTDLCKSNRYSSVDLPGARFQIFELCLKKIVQHDVPRDSSVVSVDGKLTCGETPLIFALRFRQPVIVHLLLRYGADIWIPWLSFGNAFEALVLAPNVVNIDEKEEQNILKCLQHLLDATGRTAFRSSFLGIYNSSGSQSNMRLLISRDKLDCLISREHLTCPSPLKQLSRLIIRNCVMKNGSVPDEIHSLPLPKMLQDFVDLKIH